MNEQMSIRANGGDGDFTGLKMLGALAAGAVLGLLVGLPWGRGDSVPAFFTIVQTLAAIVLPSGVLLGSLRRPVEPFHLMNVSYEQDIQQTCAQAGESQTRFRCRASSQPAGKPAKGLGAG